MNPSEWVKANCRFAQAAPPKLVPPWMSNNLPSKVAPPAQARPQAQPQPQQQRPAQQPYNAKADWVQVEPRLRRMGILPGSFEYAQYERAKQQGQDAVLRFVADLEKRYYGRVMASWVRSNCRFAIAMPRSVYEMMLEALEQEAHHARMRLKGHVAHKEAQVAAPPAPPPPAPPAQQPPVMLPKRQPQAIPQRPGIPNVDDLVVVAAAMIGRYGLTHDQFIQRMKGEFGPSIEPMLEEVYVKAREEFSKRMPNSEAVNAARAYSQSMGLPEPKRHPYAKVNPDYHKRIAQAFEAMPDNPGDQKTQAAYEQLKKEINAQYAALPIRIEKWPDPNGQPYQNSREMMQDVMDNKHMWVFDGGEAHALLSRDDMFKLRAVHDYFGHAMFGYEFGPRGEENAWIEHSKMFSPLARAALTTETRGQNAWVNYGPNSHLPASQRPYAQQKSGLLPEEFHTHEAIGS